MGKETRRAMVTGASEGIGRAFAQRLALDGYRITAVARNEARLRELVASLPGEGHEVLVADLSAAGDVSRVSDLLSVTHHGLLINNAGYGLFGKFPAQPLEKHLELMRVNMNAVVALAHVFLTRAQPGDALVNVSSGLAFSPMPASGIYTATKAFVTALSECLWFEQKGRGVYVLGLHPGPTSTEFQRRSGSGHLTPPALLVQTADAVVGQGMAALQARKKPTIIAGTWLQKFITFANRFRSRRAVVNQMGNMFPDPPAR